MAVASVTGSIVPSNVDGGTFSCPGLSTRPLLRRSCAFPKPRRCSKKSSMVSQIRAAKLPSGVEPPKEEPKLPTPLWGFTANAETWNSRAAMIGIFGLLFFELIINKGFLQLIGFDVGKGLNIPL